PIRAGGGFGDCAGHVIQTDRQARLQDGADPPSFRATGLDRAADRDPVLDHCGRARPRRAFHPPAAVGGGVPLTTFAGKKIAVFGLGASGRVSASALLVGGADVIAFDDDDASVAKANAGGIPTADLRQTDWSKIAALVLSPGVALTHPSPHWVV